MGVRDTSESYGWVSRILHWGMAIAIFATFALGWWMVGLDYYSPYYRSAPDLHRSVGIVLLILLVFRFGWRLANTRPAALGGPPWQIRAARLLHGAFYPLLLALLLSGYFISTLDGRSIDVFGLFSVPSIYTSKGLEETAGRVHEILAYLTLALAAVHAAAAIKHHAVEKSPVLARIWSGSSRRSFNEKKDHSA
jgi:cytochrome b561